MAEGWECAELLGTGNGVIAFAGEDREAFATNTDFNCVVILGAIVAARVVAERVLVAGLFGDAGIKTFKRIAFGGVEGVAAGVVRVGLQARKFAVQKTTADTETINRNTVAEKVLNGVAVSVAIGFAVLAVGDQENHFAAIAAAVLEELGGFVDGVIEGFVGSFAENHGGGRGWRSAGTDGGLSVDGGAGIGTAGVRRGNVGAIGAEAGAVKLGEKLVLIASEAFAGMEIAVEAADEGFVIGAESGDDGRKAGFNLLSIFGLEIVIEEDNDGERESFGGKEFEALFDVVVENAEFVASKIGDEMAVTVLHGDREEDVVHVEFQGGLAVGRILLIGGNLGILFRRRGGLGILSDLGDGCGGWVLRKRACWDGQGERKEDGREREGV